MADVETRVELTCLLDFYGPLLTEHRREVLRLYCEEDLSLAEIAEQLSITRQGVSDALQKGRRQLMDYEEKLGLVAKFQKSSEAIKEIDDIIDSVISKMQETADSGASDIVKNLKKIKSIIDKLED